MTTAIGATLIVAACVICGQRGAARLQEQRYRLLGAEQGLLALIKEIEYLATPLPQALERAAQSAGLAGTLFCRSSAILRNQDGVCGGEAWLLALRETRDSWSEEETAALATAAAGLGETDSASQLKHLELTRQRVSGCERLAAERAAKYGKIWRSMGWAGGAVLVLLLI